MTRRLRIAIATAGRFHVLDLARELHALGHEVKFYSYISQSRARKFGLPDECHVSLLPVVWPAALWEKFLPRFAPNLRERLASFLLNRAVIMRLQECDIFHCMSGIYLEAALFARKRFGARIWLDRGSRHILSQDEILGALSAKRPTQFAISRELAGYALADRISVPSSHVASSFARDQSIYCKLISNPYGVDLQMFPPVKNRTKSRDTVFLMVGQWSKRKGSDLLVEAIKQFEWAQLLHVGPIMDVDFPSDDKGFRHFDSVPQDALTDFYGQADVFILLSKEEGLSVVLAQALASGLPVICSDRTGGADLAHTPTLRDRIVVVRNDDKEALLQAMTAMNARLHADEFCSLISENDREALSWVQYAKRASQNYLLNVGEPVSSS
jgi:alpha-maltose-1-phosphate synthase